jgi:hypothetical protein
MASHTEDRPSPVRVTEHETGVTLDFPCPRDAHREGRLRAWRSFEIGIGLQIGAVIWYAACAMATWPAGQLLAVLPLAAGLVVLVIASNQSWAAWQEQVNDDQIIQISVVGNLLIATARDHRSQLWRREDILGISLEPMPPAETFDAVRMLITSTESYDVVMLGPVVAGDNDRGLEAELARIAYLLRRALATGRFPVAHGQDFSVSEAIQVLPEHGQETRISS